jgi:hypothetical protein
MAMIFTKYSHHSNISCIYIMQNLFPKGKEARNISLNTKYLFLMKNTRDRAQIGHLARQMYPGYSKYMVSSYEYATTAPFSYLLVDLCPETPEDIRLRTGVFPGDVMTVYKHI